MLYLIYFRGEKTVGTYVTGDGGKKLPNNNDNIHIPKTVLILTYFLKSNFCSNTKAAEQELQNGF